MLKENCNELEYLKKGEIKAVPHIQKYVQLFLRFSFIKTAKDESDKEHD